mmetsp:Transcript_30687/g.53849  ORF Transcript_30687/g.53849 Transcript_30687/m.53849 type:complete len:220 (-) Transcript_30687:339-998(-)
MPCYRWSPLRPAMQNTLPLEKFLVCDFHGRKLFVERERIQRSGGKVKVFDFDFPDRLQNKRALIRLHDRQRELLWAVDGQPVHNLWTPRRDVWARSLNLLCGGCFAGISRFCVFGLDRSIARAPLRICFLDVCGHKDAQCGPHTSDFLCRTCPSKLIREVLNKTIRARRNIAAATWLSAATATLLSASSLLLFPRLPFRHRRRLFHHGHRKQLGRMRRL